MICTGANSEDAAAWDAHRKRCARLSVHAAHFRRVNETPGLFSANRTGRFCFSIFCFLFCLSIQRYKK